MPGNDKLQNRAGNNTADKPGPIPYNSFFSAREAVPIDNASGDIEVIPTPPPGFVRILDDAAKQNPSFGQIAEITPTVTGYLIYQDQAGNEQTLEFITSAAGIILPTAPESNTAIPHLVNGERVIFRPLVPGNPGEAVFLGSWLDTDLDAARADLTTTMQTIAKPPRGKTWALLYDPMSGYPYEALACWNFDSIVHEVELFLFDGTNNIPIDASMLGVAAWVTPPPTAGEAYAQYVAQAGLVIPDGCELRGRVEDAPVSGPCRILAPFFEVNSSKLANYPTF